MGAPARQGGRTHGQRGRGARRSKGCAKGGRGARSPGSVKCGPLPAARHADRAQRGSDRCHPGGTAGRSVCCALTRGAGMEGAAHAVHGTGCRPGCRAFVAEAFRRLPIWLAPDSHMPQSPPQRPQHKAPLRYIAATLPDQRVGGHHRTARNPAPITQWVRPLLARRPPDRRCCLPPPFSCGSSRR
jgi:hypothetical protein